MIKSFLQHHGIVKPDNDMADMMKTVWQGLGINLELSTEDEAVCESTLQKLFNTNSIRRELIEEANAQLIELLNKYLMGKWESVASNRIRQDIVGIAEKEGINKDVAAVEWIAQKSVMGMMEAQFGLDDVREFNATQEHGGCIIFSQNGSMVFCEGLEYENVYLKDENGAYTVFLTNNVIIAEGMPYENIQGEDIEHEEGLKIAKSTKVRNATYMRIPSRRTGIWKEPTEGKGLSINDFKVGERAMTPVSHTSNVRQILAIPTDQLQHLKFIIELSRSVMSSRVIR